MSLIKKASYLADNGRVTFGHHSKLFTSVRLQERETECVFVGTSHRFNEKVDRKGDNSRVDSNQVSSWDTQAPLLLCLGVILTPSILIQIY